MSRSAADRARGGFTLIEITVALAVSGILVSGLTYFFKSFTRSFNLQEQISDRDQNAHYALKRMSETLMAAGADLPAKGWDVISLPGGSPAGRIRLSLNPRGGIQYVTGPVTGRELPVDDPKGFGAAGSVLVDPMDPAKPVYKVAIDAGYSANGFVKGIKTAASGGRLRVSADLRLDAGDVAYAYAEEEYRLAGTNLMLGSMVLAENIESLAITFHAANQAATTQWAAMRSARIQVRARTRLPDPGLKKDGGYRRLDLSTDVMLRNRL